MYNNRLLLNKQILLRFLFTDVENSSVIDEAL
jgi:hypothetical protein